MLSKILTGTFVLIMVGAVIAGAIAVFGPADEAHASTRAQEHETLLSQGQGQGQGQGYGQDHESQGQGRGQGGQGYGQGQEGQGSGQGLGRGQAAGAETEAVPVDTTLIEGVVVETDELYIETADGETVQVGLGPSAYREAQGFVLQAGENVRVSGYWETEEFKAIQLENLTTGQSIILRDSTGRPMWAGQGRGQNR